MRVLDPVHKYMVFSEHESALIDSVVFQRLRYIRQLGFAEFAFPGAVHSRFLHSLGVCHLTGRAFDSLSDLNNLLTPRKKKNFRKIIRLTALLHDIGHGPLSHISETAMPPLQELSLPFFPLEKQSAGKQALHEHYTIKLLLQSELKDIITSMDMDPHYPAHLIDSRVPVSDPDFFISNGVDFKPLLKQMVSSDLDMDRMDYLQRDSFFCGTDYGFCDHEWILNNLRLHIQDGRAFMGIGQKAIYSVESFFLGRRQMGLAVYFHNKMAAMDEMLYRYFTSDNCQFRIPVALEEYLRCTDAALFENLRSVASANEWARRIITKTPYEKVGEIQYTLAEEALRLQKSEQIKQFLRKKGVPFIYSNSADHVKRFYLQDTVSFPVYIVDESTGKAVNLREKMQMFSQKDHILLMDRVYVPPEDRKISQDIAKIIQQ